MTNEATAAAALPGTVVHSADAGHARIDVIRAVGGWTVKAWHGVEAAAGWTDSFNTKREAWDAFQHAVAAFEKLETAQAIADRRNLLAIQRGPIADRLDRSRNAETRAAYTAQIEAIDTEMAQLEDLAAARVRVRAQQFAEAA